MDELMSSLLVWHNGGLVPASSVSSCASGDAERCERRAPVVGLPMKKRRKTEEQHEPKKRETSLQPSPEARAPWDYRYRQTPTSSTPTYTNILHPRAMQAFAMPNDYEVPPPSAQPLPTVVTAAQPLPLVAKMDINVGSHVPSNPPAFHGLPLMTMEEFDRQNPYVPPPPKLTAARSEAQYGQHVTAFHEACQARGLFADYEYKEVSPQCFHVALLVNNQIIDSIGPYLSKKDAKNEVCRRALGKLADIALSTNSKKRKSSDSVEPSFPLPAHIEDENWVGLLMQYLQPNKQWPDFIFTGARDSSTMGPWKCQLTFEGSPTMPFGDGLGPFSKKDEAKKVAAMEAVAWLRQSGRLSEKPRAKPQTSRKSITAVPSMPPGRTESTQLLESIDLNNSAITSNQPVGKQVHQLALSLGFTQPAFQINQRDGAFVDVWAVFDTRDARFEPRLAGEVGRVDHVFGKKAAKDACWLEVLKVLESIRRDRRAALT